MLAKFHKYVFAKDQDCKICSVVWGTGQVNKLLALGQTEFHSELVAGRDSPKKLQNVHSEGTLNSLPIIFKPVPGPASHSQNQHTTYQGSTSFVSTFYPQ